MKVFSGSASESSLVVNRPFAAASFNDRDADEVPFRCTCSNGSYLYSRVKLSILGCLDPEHGTVPSQCASFYRLKGFDYRGLVGLEPNRDQSRSNLKPHLLIFKGKGIEEHRH